jgi:PKD repeat protein
LYTLRLSGADCQVKEDDPVSDKEPESGGKSGGWLKTCLGTIAGLCSGAVMMYLSPLLDMIVKPAQPQANFAVEHQGLAASFHNRSLHYTSGWWDFGDGSPLEPVNPGQDVLTHTYPDAGDYTAKVTVRNLIGEENDRSVAVHLATAQAAPPQIASLDIVPVSAGCYAPATFRITTKVKNAQVCVWDFSDGRPLEVITDVPDTQDRLVTFQKPRRYTIKLAAVNAGQATEKTTTIDVLGAPTGTVTALVNVLDRGTRVETLNSSYAIAESFPPQSRESVFAINRQVPARMGFEIREVRLQSGQGPAISVKNGQMGMDVDPAALGATGARKLHLQLSPDRQVLSLTGELFKTGGLLKRNQGTPAVLVPVVIVQKRRSPTQRPPVPVAATLTIPGSALLALPDAPPGWEDLQRQLRLEMRDGDQSILPESPLPHSGAILVRGRRCTLTATPLGDHVRIDLSEVPPPLGPPAAN